MDLVHVDRLSRIRHESPGLLERVFTSGELAYCIGRRRQDEHLAARFAAKEAALKALGTGIGSGVDWHDLAVDRGLRGRPALHMAGRALQLAHEARATGFELSLSHTSEYAVATVIMLLDTREGT